MLEFCFKKRFDIDTRMFYGEREVETLMTID